MRIPGLHTLWEYKDVIVYVAEKKVRGDGCVWVSLKYTRKAGGYWLTADKLYINGKPLRTPLGEMRYWEVK